MTRYRLHRAWKAFRRSAIVGGVAAWVISGSLASEGPVLRSGLCKFERTLETNGKPTNRLQTSGLAIGGMNGLDRVHRRERHGRSPILYLMQDFCVCRLV
jgi:hypothetical protein